MPATGQHKKQKKNPKITRMRYPFQSSLGSGDEIGFVPEWTSVSIYMIFRDRISDLNESFLPEQEPGANSIQNDCTFVPELCKHCAKIQSSKRVEWRKRERIYSSSKLDPVARKHSRFRGGTVSEPNKRTAQISLIAKFTEHCSALNCTGIADAMDLTAINLLDHFFR